MDLVTISPKYQAVIPKAVREEMGLVPGQGVQVIAYGSRIEIIPVRPVRELRGILVGCDVTGEREERDRL